MADEREFHFPLSVLERDGDLILTAAGKYAAQLNPRLPDGHVAAARTLLQQLGTDEAKQKSDAGDLGDLTLAQDEKAKLLLQLLSDAKETAKKAFKHQDVKLSSEFQVGVNKPNDLTSVLGRARIILASLQKAAN